MLKFLKNWTLPIAMLVGATPSDHFPVKVELEFDQRQQK